MMNETDAENLLDYEYKCGKLSEVVIDSLRAFLGKIRKNGLKRTAEMFLPGVNLNDLVLHCSRYHQLIERREH